MNRHSELTAKLRPLLDALRYERSDYAWMCVALGNYDEICNSVNSVNDVVAWSAALAMCNEAKRALVVLESYVIATCAVVFAGLIACKEIEENQHSKRYTLKVQQQQQQQQKEQEIFTFEYIETLLQLRNKLMSLWYAKCYSHKNSTFTPEATVANTIFPSTLSRVQTGSLSAAHESIAKSIMTAAAATTPKTTSSRKEVNSNPCTHKSVTNRNNNLEENLTELQYVHLLLYACKDDALCRSVLRLVLGITDWVAIHRWYIVSLYLYDAQSNSELLQEEEPHELHQRLNDNEESAQRRNDKGNATQIHSTDSIDNNCFGAGIYHAPCNLWFRYYMSLFTPNDNKEPEKEYFREEQWQESSAFLFSNFDSSKVKNSKQNINENVSKHNFNKKSNSNRKEYSINEVKLRLNQQETLSILLSHCEEWEVEMITSILAHKQRRYRTCMLSATHALQSDECVLVIAALSSAVQTLETKLYSLHNDCTSEAMYVLFAELSYVVMMLYMRCISALELTERPQAGADIKTLMELGQKWLTLRTAVMNSSSEIIENNVNEESVKKNKNKNTKAIITTAKRNNSNKSDLICLSDAYLLIAVSCAIAMFGLGLPEAEAVILPAPKTQNSGNDNTENSSKNSNSKNDAVIAQLNASARRYVYSLAEYIHSLTLMQLGEVSSAIRVAQEAVPFASVHEVGNNLCQLIVYGATAMEDSSCILSTALSPHCLLYLALCPAFFGGLTRHGVKLKESSATYNLLSLHFPVLYMSSRQALPLYVCAAQHALTSHNLSSAWVNINRAVAIADDVVGSLEFIFSDCYPLKVYFMGILIGQLYSEHLLTQEVKAAQACLEHEQTNEKQIKAKEELFARHDVSMINVLHTCEHFVEQMENYFPYAYLSNVACTLVAMMQHDKLSLSKAILLARRYPNRVMAQNLLTLSLFHNLHIPEAVDAAQKNIQDFPHTREIVTTAQMLHKRRVLYTFNYRTLLPLQYAPGKHDRVFTKRMIVVIVFVCIHVTVTIATLIFNAMSIERINHLSSMTNAIAVRLQLPSLAPLYFAVLYFVHAIMSTITEQNLVRVLLTDLYFCNSRLSRFLFCMRGIALVNVCNALQISLRGDNFIAPNILVVIFIYIILWVLFVPFTSRVWFLPSNDEPSVKMLSWATLLCIDALIAIVLFIPHLILAAIEPLMSVVFNLYTPVPRPDREAASSSIRRRLLYHEHHKHDMPHRFAIGSGSHFVYIRLLSLLYYETHSLMETLHLSASQLEEECYRVFPLFDPEIVGQIDCKPLRAHEQLAMLFSEQQNDSKDDNYENHDINDKNQKTTSNNKSDACLTDMEKTTRLIDNSQLSNHQQSHTHEHLSKLNTKVSPDARQASSDMINALKREFGTQKMDNLRRIASFVKPKAERRSSRTSNYSCNNKKKKIGDTNQYSFNTDDDEEEVGSKARNELQTMEENRKAANSVETACDARQEHLQHIEDILNDDLSLTSSSSLSSSTSFYESDYSNSICTTKRYIEKTMSTSSKNKENKTVKQVNEGTRRESETICLSSANALETRGQQQLEQQSQLQQNNEEEMVSFFYSDAEPWIAAEMLSSQLLAEILSIPTRRTATDNATPTEYDDIEF